jgi:hypothetical protein
MDIAFEFIARSSQYRHVRANAFRSHRVPGFRMAVPYDDRESVQAARTIAIVTVA